MVKLLIGMLALACAGLPQAVHAQAYPARARPDGHTLLMTASTFAMNIGLFKPMPYDPVRDFEPIGLAAWGSLLLVANAAAPEIRSSFAAQGLDPTASTPEEFRTLIETDLGKWMRVVREAKISAE